MVCLECLIKTKLPIDFSIKNALVHRSVFSELMFVHGFESQLQTVDGTNTHATIILINIRKPNCVRY